MSKYLGVIYKIYKAAIFMVYCSFSLKSVCC